MLSLDLRPEILIVEDDTYWIEHYRVALKHLSIDIREAKSVKEAAILLSKNFFAVVIIDLSIPGIKESTLGGFEVIESSKKRNPYTELLVITGHTAHEVLDRVSRAGVRFITKSVDHRELALSVEAMIAAWKKRFSDLVQVLFELPTSAAILEDRGKRKPTLKIKDEYDLQDLLHFAYKPFFPDVIVEEYTLKRAGRTKRLDLVFRALETVIETKMIRNKSHAKTIPDELDIDIRGYVAHPYCRRLICYVYDPQKFVKDPRSIEQDLSGEQRQDSKFIDVIVLIRPF